MSNRLDQEREAVLQPKRLEFAKEKIKALNLEIIQETGVLIRFKFKGEIITFYPYSGWHSGKTINDGRGIKKLLTQISK